MRHAQVQAGGRYVSVPHLFSVGSADVGDPYTCFTLMMMSLALLLLSRLSAGCHSGVFQGHDGSGSSAVRMICFANGGARAASGCLSLAFSTQQMAVKAY